MKIAVIDAQGEGLGQAVIIIFLALEIYKPKT